MEPDNNTLQGKKLSTPAWLLCKDTKKDATRGTMGILPVERLFGMKRLSINSTLTFHIISSFLTSVVAGNIIMTILKVTFGQTIRRLPSGDIQSLPALRSFLSSHFKLTPATSITYKDEDSDDITFTTEEEFLSVLAESSDVLRLKLVTPAQNTPADALTSKVSDLIDAIRAQTLQSSVEPTVSAEPTIRGRIHKNTRSLPVNVSKGPSSRAPRGPGRVPIVKGKAHMKTYFNGIRPFFAVFPPRKLIRTKANSIKQETRQSFKSASRTIKRSEQRSEIVASLKLCTPELRHFISSIPMNRLPSTESVEALSNVVGQKLQSTDENIRKDILSFIGIAAEDPAFVACLSALSDVPLMPWEDGFAAVRIGKRPFDTHQVQCSVCEVSPIVGIRHKCATDNKRNLCGKCFTSENVNDNVFETQKYIWESPLRDAIVPPPPLTMGDRGIPVKFLHFIMLKLGYMDAKMIEKRPGLFVLNTKNAVLRFQRDHQLAGEGVYDQTTAEHLESAFKDHSNETTEDVNMDDHDN